VCWFITVGVRREGIAALEELAHQPRGLGVQACTNASLRSMFPADDTLYFVTHGGCSCGLVVMPVATRVARASRRVERWRKQGWSDAKIQRALEDSRAKETSAPAAVDPAVTRWIGALAQQVELCRGVRVHAHMFRGDVQREAVPSPTAARMTIAELRAAAGAFPADALIEIVRTPA
jgi:hypothetical protein